MFSAKLAPISLVLALIWSSCAVPIVSDRADLSPRQESAPEIDPDGIIEGLIGNSTKVFAVRDSQALSDRDNKKAPKSLGNVVKTAVKDITGPLEDLASPGNGAPFMGSVGSSNNHNKFLV